MASCSSGLLFEKTADFSELAFRFILMAMCADFQFENSFVEFMLTHEIDPQHVLLPLSHGKYDGYVIMLHKIANANEIKVFQKLICLLECFVGNNSVENDREEPNVELFLWHLLSFDSLFLLVDLLQKLIYKRPNCLLSLSENALHNIFFFFAVCINPKYIDKWQTCRFSNKSIVLNISMEKFHSNLINLFCIVFTLDIDLSVMYGLYCLLHRCLLLKSLLLLTKIYPNCTGTLLGLFAHLVITDEMFIPQLQLLLTIDETNCMLQDLLTAQNDVGALCDLLAALSHMSRQSSDNVVVIVHLFAPNESGNLFIYIK